jgi:hypothetical protein
VEGRSYDYRWENDMDAGPPETPLQRATVRHMLEKYLAGCPELAHKCDPEVFKWLADDDAAWLDRMRGICGRTRSA